MFLLTTLPILTSWQKVLKHKLPLILVKTVRHNKHLTAISKKATYAYPLSFFISD